MAVLMRRGAAVAAALVLLVAVGCGDDDDDSSAVCEDRDQLSASVQALGDVDVTADGVDALRTAVDDVVDDVDQLAEDAGDELSDEIDAVRDAISDVGTVLGTIGDQSVAGVIESLQAELTELSDAAQALVDEAGQACN